MTPEQCAASGTEHGNQKALFCWAALNKKQYPELDLLFAIPNGGSRGDSAKSRAIRGAQLKAEGVKKGFPDVGLPVARRGYHALYIELKRPKSDTKKKGVEADEQGEWAIKLRAEGNYVETRYGWESAADLIIKYLT